MNPNCSKIILIYPLNSGADVVCITPHRNPSSGSLPAPAPEGGSLERARAALERRKRAALLQQDNDDAQVTTYNCTTLFLFNYQTTN